MMYSLAKYIRRFVITQENGSILHKANLTKKEILSASALIAINESDKEKSLELNPKNGRSEKINTILKHLQR